MVRGDSTGDVVFYGKGAGKLPTASAVVADVIDCVKHFKARKYLYWEDGSEDYVEDYRLNVISMYVRVKTDDEALALKNVKQVFGEVTRLSRKNAENGEFAFVTNSMKEEEILTKLEKLKSMGICVENTIRIGNL